tara:strand:- start:581 stop:967 length:387 start_codon:yes stop_codon:yes gene_type:complete
MKKDLHNKKVKRLESALNDLIIAMDIAVYELAPATKMLDKKLIDADIEFEDEKWLELMGVDSFTLHCTNIRNLIVSIMYCINKPALLQKIQEHVLLESMKKEITDGKDVPQDVIDEFLDFMNMVKNKQ